ncbi:MAG: hypothetical protein HYX24_02265 [Candidatus Aenigmarchaeota archaeon]|nr:hypothetical protein [Candidatus Aenigmarchaeota archaeon]
MKKGPVKKEIIKKILKLLNDNPKGVWLRKLAREIKEPLPTVNKYVKRPDYAGQYIIVEKFPKELGGHLMLKLNYRKSAEVYRMLRE